MHSLLLLFLFLLFDRAVSRQTPVLYLADGSPLQGQQVYAKNGKLVSQFLGIPFGQPPIGRLRFKKPEPVRPWRRVLNASSLPNSCVQSADTYFGDFPGATMWNANTDISEDCLYLNVWRPGQLDAPSRLPVMIWVYGGGFWSGTSSLPVYDGKLLSTEENVIIVSMNYRVSLFGFLYLGRQEAPGNMGLWDQLLAMKWVKKNIDKFGGDAATVTLFGESAGGASVSMHVLSPKSAPYFQRAIMQSGSATAPWAIESRQVALSRPVALCEAIKCGNMSHREPDTWDYDKVLECLMQAPADQLRAHEWSPVMEFADFPWVPVIDGDLLVEQVATSLKQGHFKTSQLLVGSNLDEAIYFIVYQLQDVFIRDQFFTKTEFVTTRETWLRSVLNLLPRHIAKSLPARQAVLHEYEPYQLPVSPQQWVDSIDKMLGDLQFTCNMNEFALAHAFHGGSSYYYYFTHRASAQTWPAWMGVLHGYEINFVFGEPLNTHDYSYTDEERQLSRRFMRYWANFARTGNPNVNVDGTYMAAMWPQYSQSTMEYINLTVQSEYERGAGHTGHGPRRKQCAFWKHVLPRLMSAIADYSDVYVRWKQQFDRWQNEYIVDWQLQFEQYKRYQSYRTADSDGQCS